MELSERLSSIVMDTALPYDLHHLTLDVLSLIREHNTQVRLSYDECLQLIKLSIEEMEGVLNDDNGNLSG